jgi:nitrogen regulatory protein PII
LALGINQYQLLTITYNPNPVKDILNIMASETIKNVTVYNVLGQLLFMQREDNNEFNVDLSNLPTSNYFIKVESEDKNQVIKVIKQ